MNWKIIVGDVRDKLADLPAGSVQCCVTSPPYWGLRDYGTASWEGGDPDCDHSPEKRGGRFAIPVSGLQATNAGSGTASSRNCSCGAVRIDDQIGLEATPELYVASIVEVFAAVRRVLADDGTLWINIGDSYVSRDGQRKTTDAVGPMQSSNGGSTGTPSRSVEGLAAKNLAGIPWRCALGLQADGWYLRSDIIWNKLNPMPESVSDRPTKAHEYIFLLTKSARYYYDAEAIAEPSVGREIFGNSRSKGHCEQRSDNERRDMTPTETRNKRSVWTLATNAYPGAHFATYPPALIEPCILAGSKPGDTILDPFNGSGTTGEVAIRYQRNYIGVELNPAYVELARNRISAVAPLFAREIA